MYIIDKDIEMYGVYDDIRESADVQHVIKQEVAKAVEKDLQKQDVNEKKRTSKKRGR